jgi:alanine racemase
VTRFRPTLAEVDLEAIRHNAGAMKPPRAELMAVVKSNGYGHGAVPCANAALSGGATWLGVALVEEGIALRDSGIEAPVLVLSEFPAGAEKDALAAGLTPTVYTEPGVEAIAQVARDLGITARIHLKVDTGMHRVGLYPPEAAVAFARGILASGLELEGLWTHFARSEEDEKATSLQLDRFLSVSRSLDEAGITPRLRHAANSAAVVRHPESHLDLVRVGIAIYGLDCAPGVAASMGLRPALSWRSEVTMVRRLPAGERLSYGHRYRLERDSTVATVPVGYADGYPRILSNRAHVLVGGERRRVAGTITMDQLLVDCEDDDVQSGDEVVLIGRQGKQEVTADELASLSGTIGYEITCGISERVPREYAGGPGGSE